jgi:hypothetical protein
MLVVLASACRRQPTPPVVPREGKRAPKPVALTPDVALSRIQDAYRGGVQRCYHARLKREPRARGRMIVTFTVDETGRVASGNAKGVGRALGKPIELCVERAMLRWSFPAPRAETTFRVALALSSDA